MMRHDLELKDELALATISNESVQYKTVTQTAGHPQGRCVDCGAVRVWREGESVGVKNGEV